MIRFIPRRMYENYLLNSRAIAAVLTKADQQRKYPVTEQEVSDSLGKNRQKRLCTDAQLSSDWIAKVDAARLLNDTFNELSETRVCFDKTNHGVKLTEWLIDNEPSELQELAEFLKAILAPDSTKAEPADSP